MDYSKLSDFEINKKVAKALKCTIFGYKSGNPIISSITGLAFDPCNNPNHSWHLILENKISLNCYRDEEEGKDYWEAASYDSVNNSKQWEVADDSNPLRAAMIVFLKIKEGT